MASVMASMIAVMEMTNVQLRSSLQLLQRLLSLYFCNLFFFLASDRLRDSEDRKETENRDISKQHLVRYVEKKSVAIGGVYIITTRDVDNVANSYGRTFLSSILPKQLMPHVPRGGILKKGSEMAQKNRCMDFQDNSQRIAECRLKTKYYSIMRRMIKPLDEKIIRTYPWLNM